MLRLYALRSCNLRGQYKGYVAWRSPRDEVRVYQERCFVDPFVKTPHTQKLISQATPEEPAVSMKLVVLTPRSIETQDPKPLTRTAEAQKGRGR